MSSASPPQAGLTDLSLERPAFGAIVESLPDPVLVIAAHDAENLSDRRVVYANPAARELLRIQVEGATLVSAIRHPRVLEAVDESLFGEINGEAAYETGGAQDRFWRVRTRPLERARDGAFLALMVLRDETDSRRNERMRADFLANASHELRTPLAAERGVTFSTRLAPRGTAMIVGDRDQILQVAQNLIDNAVKYSPNGGVVDIELADGLTADEAITATRQGGARLSLLSPDLIGGERFVMLRCADRGPGIAREYLPRLSERFYRVEGQKSGERLGTGLGLAIVKHITNRHRGGLAIESVEGQGTTFTAYFPRSHQGQL